MNKYEITIITKEDEKDAAVKKEIEILGGKITDVQTLGQRQLAFPIKKETAGFYTAVAFEILPEKVTELNRKLGLKSEIIRHLILTAKPIKVEPEKPKAAKAVEAPVEKPEVAEKKVTAIEEAPETEITEVKEPKKKAEKAEIPAKKSAAKPKKEAEKPKAEKPAEEPSAEDRLKALDEKLNELLKE